MESEERDLFPAYYYYYYSHYTYTLISSPDMPLRVGVAPPPSRRSVVVAPGVLYRIKTTSTAYDYPTTPITTNTKQQSAFIYDQLRIDRVKIRKVQI